MELVFAAGMLGVSVAVGVVVFLAREGRISSGALRALAVACSLALLAMLITDWPWQVLSRFWAEHSVVAGVLSTILLVGIGFLIFEVRDVREQESLDRSLTAAGLGGLVDHVVDVEIAMALLCSDVSPDHHGWPGWSQPGRPLRWLRADRARVARSGNGGPSPTDPRGWPVALERGAEKGSDWRLELVDQSVRRLLAAIRDWSPVTGRSRNGIQALITMAELRNSLMLLEVALGNGDLADGDRLILDLRRRCRVLAHALEKGSGAPHLRSEVLTSLTPLGARERTGERPTARWLRNEWLVQLDRSETQLGGHG